MSSEPAMKPHVSRETAPIENLSSGPPTELMESIVAGENMKRAWQRVRSNHGAPGVDGMSVEAADGFLRAQWPRIRRALVEGTYTPQPVRRCAIPKPDGTERMLGIPTVLDRLIQQAIQQVLTPMFDPEFSVSSYGFRPARSAHGAIQQVRSYIEEGCRIAVDMDLAKFFDQVSHDVLMVRVARKVQDRRVLRLIGRYLRAGVQVGGDVEPTTQGTPQGSPLSPLLANILLDDFDKELERRRLRFARYADDVFIVVRTREAGERVMASLVRWLRSRLKLEVNSTKSKVAPVSHCTFLGYTFYGDRLRLPDKTLEKFKQRVRELTRRNHSIPQKERIERLNVFLRGWMNYFGLSETKSLWSPLDEWIRRRLRMCLWKQWHKPRTRVRRLLALGVPKALAIRTATSSKGYWRLAKTLAAHCGLTTAWFDAQGLIRLRYRWRELAPLR